MSRRYRALLRFSLLLLLLEPADAAAVEYSSTKTDLDYEFGDYRGKWCIDDHGFVYAIGEVYYPSPSGCPCTCTVNGPVCIRPKCPRIHPRCTRIRYKACCPVCEAVARVCVYGGKTYRLLEEFRVRRCRTVCTSHTHTHEPNFSKVTSERLSVRNLEFTQNNQLLSPYVGQRFC